MSIVSRGLGRGAAAILVTAGLGMSAPATLQEDAERVFADGPDASPLYEVGDDEMFRIAFAVIASGILDSA